MINKHKYPKKCTHGMYRTRIHVIWTGMKQRCTNHKSDSFSSHGGRGIVVCDRWNKFINFYEDMKDGYSDDLTLDRIDNNGHYCKENCRWATKKEQSNNMRNNHRLIFNGLNLTISEWSRKTGMTWSTINNRVLRGWCVKDILTKEVNKSKVSPNRYKVASM